VGQKIVAIRVEGNAVVEGNVYLPELEECERRQLRNLAQKLSIKLHQSPESCCITTDKTTTGKVRVDIRHNTTAKKHLRRDRDRFINLLRSQGLVVTLCREDIDTDGDSAPCYQNNH